MAAGTEILWIRKDRNSTPVAGGQAQFHCKKEADTNLITASQRREEFCRFKDKPEHPINYIQVVPESKWHGHKLHPELVVLPRCRSKPKGHDFPLLTLSMMTRFTFIWSLNKYARALELSDCYEGCYFHEMKSNKHATKFPHIEPTKMSHNF
ncbi:hypothetical protein VNO77_27209 [Canavalia gladiata]|uniref:Uncharacterized protein n=1 Tax=Canavalia gladiata TaxID=3824 RepID=A0AAN9Q6X0_CANGL